MKILWQGQQVKPGKDGRYIKLIPSNGAERAWLENLEKELDTSTVITIGMLKKDGVHRGFCIDFVTVGKNDRDTADSEPMPID